MATVPRCDGIPLQDLKFYSYKKVAPTADGLDNSYDPVVFFERIIELKLIPSSTILKTVADYGILIIYPPESLVFESLFFYLTESNILPF